MSASLYNLSPVGHLLMMGGLLALGPLTWVWLRHRHQSPGVRVRQLTLLTIFLTFDLVMFGAFTRLTDSGLGCPDWPGCYGHASPVGADTHIAAAQAALPTGPVTAVKAWIEMIHRYFATAVGVLILTLAIDAWWPRRSLATAARPSRAWATLTLLWVMLQGAFGALTVTMKLFPAIVTLHLLGGLVLLVLLTCQAVDQGRSLGLQQDVHVSGLLRKGLWAGAGLLLVQVLLGGWVSTNYAVLACSQFPLCQDRWWPAMNFSAGFELWRPLGLLADGQAIPFEALTAMHYTHRLMAYAVLVVLGGLAVAMRRQGLRTQARLLQWLLLLQLLTGVSNVVLDWPLLAAVLHTGGAAALCVTLAWSWRVSQAAQPPGLSRWQQFNALTKPRVIQLIVFCALIGMVLAVPGVPSWGDVRRALLACLGIWLVAGAAAAFNCLVEKQIDARMKRTAWRPTAKGELRDHETLGFATLLCVAGSAILYVGVNPLSMWLTFATFVGYAVIYTVILKPLTPQNIVIGGASGAMPPVLGWTAMTGEVAPEALILFLIIFLWTPPHFWALALYRVEDYRQSGLPMLPVTHGNAFTRLQIFLYTWMLMAACLMPYIYGMSGLFYLVAALLLSLGFCGYAWALWRNYSDALARKTFRFSLIHLSLLFVAFLIDHYL
jgi:protoheme IX farnesyltransferase